MRGLMTIIDALKAGHELSNSETWKNRQAATGLVAVVLSALVVVAGWAGFKPDIDGEVVQTAAGGVVALFGLLNAYLSLATSKRVGLPDRGVGEPGQAEPDAPSADMARGDDHPSGG